MDNNRNELYGRTEIVVLYPGRFRIFLSLYPWRFLDVSILYIALPKRESWLLITRASRTVIILRPSRYPTFNISFLYAESCGWDWALRHRSNNGFEIYLLVVTVLFVSRMTLLVALCANMQD